MPKCPIHKINLVCFCPACEDILESMRGEKTSKKKSRASRENGKLGGRPPKKLKKGKKK